MGGRVFMASTTLTNIILFLKILIRSHILIIKIFIRFSSPTFRKASNGSQSFYHQTVLGTMSGSTLQRHESRRREEADPQHAETLIFKVRKIIINCDEIG